MQHSKQEESTLPTNLRLILHTQRKCQSTPLFSISITSEYLNFESGCTPGKHQAKEPLIARTLRRHTAKGLMGPDFRSLVPETCFHKSNTTWEMSLRSLQKGTVSSAARKTQHFFHSAQKFGHTFPLWHRDIDPKHGRQEQELPWFDELGSFCREGKKGSICCE